MARKKNKSGSGGGDAEPVAAVAAPADTKGGEDKDEAAEDASSTEVELLQVDVGDIIKLKQVLDESVAGALLDLDGPALKEDHKSDNIKLCIMVLACCFAFVAQFAPLPFPESRPVLGLCCISYFVLSGVLQLVTTFHDKDCIMVTQPVEKAKYPTKNKEVETYGIRVRTQLPRFSEFYTVVLEFQGNSKDGKKAAPGPYVSKTWSVGQFFDVDGFFAEDILMDEIEALYANFCQGKFGKPEDYDDGSQGILHLIGFEGLEKSLNDKKKATSGKVKTN